MLSEELTKSMVCFLFFLETRVEVEEMAEKVPTFFGRKVVLTDDAAQIFTFSFL